MKKINILLIALVALAAAAQAEVLFTEDFEYPDGSVLTVNPDWFLQWGGDTHMPIVSPGLTMTGYTAASNDKALLIEGDYSNDMPHHAFTQVTTGDVFVALLYEPTFVTKPGYFLTLRDEKANNSAYNYCGRIYAGVDDNYNPTIGLRFFKKAAAEFADLQLEETKTYLVVMRYHIVEGSNNDEISLYLFDALPEKMPAKPLIGPLVDPEAPDINPAHIVLHTYDDDGMLTIDGLRIATTFHEAVGIPESEPEGIALFEDHKQHYSLLLRDGHIAVTDGTNVYTLLGQKK